MHSLLHEDNPTIMFRVSLHYCPKSFIRDPSQRGHMNGIKAFLPQITKDIGNCATNDMGR